MKSALIVLIVLVGLAMAAGYTPWQEGASQGLKIGFHLGTMYNQAQQGYNISGFNKEVDIYNAWVQKNFGNDSSLLMQKIPMPGYGNVPTMYNKPVHAIDESFNQSRRILGDAAVSNEGRILDMPASAYYTWNPSALGNQPTLTNSQTYGGLGSV
ncbi:MAG: hypothetical protein MUO26_15440 [Methanotrichaceae archaeon]|nr:hypothetical protein [Methanotrichaceae archaeon]